VDRIGVAISTHNRRPVLLESLHHWRAHMPADAALLVIDDASDEPLDVPGLNVVRHDYRRGVAMTKNRGLTELIDVGVKHLFLADDDVHPITGDWWRPYVESPEPHLSYQWTRGHVWRETHNDGTHWSISFPRGVMLYTDRKVIDTIGGYDPAYGMHGGEHVDFSRRAHDAGLTSWAFADVCGSNRIWYARDEHEGNMVGSTTPIEDRRLMCAANGTLWDKRAGYVPYREREGVQDYNLGPDLTRSPIASGDPGLACLQHVLTQKPPGTAVEFGVGSGRTLRMIAAVMPAVGFDSFQGLPEDWRPEFPKGSFAADRPHVPNATVVEGLFADTLPNFDFGKLGHIGLVNFDADLLSSTRTALEYIGPYLRPGCFLHFDEWFGYDGCEHYEQKAFKEWAARTGRGWSVLGHGIQQWLVRLT